MKRNFKKFVAAILTMALVIGNVPVGIMQAKAEEADSQNVVETVSEVAATPVPIVAEGACGENLTWTLDAAGVLTVSGTGKMTDFDMYDDDALPSWYSHRFDICSVIVLEGVTSIGDYAFGASGLTSIELPETLTSIGWQAFYGCSSLISIKIPSGVTSIGDSTFWGCSSLTSIELLETLTNISDLAFYGCSSLTSIEIPEGVTHIGDEAFEGCTGLTSIELPETLTRIDYAAFRGCSGLKEVYYNGTKEQWSNVAIEDDNEDLIEATIHYTDTDLMPTATPAPTVAPTATPAPIVAEGTCGEDLAYTLDEKGLLTISGTGEMTDFDYDEVPWYSHRSDICSVIVLEGVTGIGSWAFDGCSSLTSVELPESLSKIGDSAFEQCSGLTSIKIPEGVTSIGAYAFCYCSSLTSIEMLEGITSISEGAFWGCSGLTSVKIPEGVTSIEGDAFRDCLRLTRVEIPEGVTSIEGDAFRDCGGLTDVYYMGTREQWDSIEIVDIYDGNKALSYATIRFLTPMPTPAPIEKPYIAEGTCGENLTWTLDEEGVLSFSGTGEMICYYEKDAPWLFHTEYVSEINISKINISKGMTSIGDWAFYGCSSLTNIEIPEGVTSIGTETFYGCSSLASIEIPEGVTSIGGDAFYGCRSLTSVELPQSVTFIGPSAFEGCSSLTSVELSEGVTRISECAFDGCSSLTSVEIPEKVTYVGYRAFNECSALTDVYYTGTQRQWESITVSSDNDYLLNANIHFAKVDPTYTITWLNSDGTLLEEDANVEYGTIPTFDSETPVKAANAQFTYTFAGWSPEVTEVTGDATYKAVYEGTINSYTVTWLNFDGTVLAEEVYEYGEMPEYKGSTPEYEEVPFKGWSPTISEVTDDATYTAQYNFSGIYWEEENGAQVGYYYVDGKVKKGAGIVQVGDYLYYVLSSGKIATGGSKTIKEATTNGLVAPGTYYFYKNGVLETDEVRLSGEIRWRDENGKLIGEYYVMDELRKDVGLVELWNEEAEEECWYYVLYSGKVKRNNVADGKRVNQTIKENKRNKYTGPAGTYSFYEDGVMYDPYATETGIVKYDANGKPYYYVDGHIRKDAGLVLVSRGDHEGDYVFVTYSGTLKKGTQTVKASKCNGHTEFVGTQKFDSTTGAMIIK